MKKIIEVSKSESGLESLLGETVTFFCCRYFYTGKLVGVNNTCVELENPKVVYETGSYDSKDWQDAQSLPHKTYFIQTAAIESFGIIK